MNFYEMLAHAVSANASDIHLASGNLPAVRIDGIIHPLGQEALTPEQVDGIAKLCLPPEKYQDFLAAGDADCA